MSERVMYCQPMTILLMPRMWLKMFMEARAKVVVLIPPPVDPGDAPTHMSKR